MLAQITWDVSPEIFRIGPLPIRWYSVGWLLAFGLGFYLVRWMYQKEGKPEKDLESVLLYMILGAIIGARLGHCLFYRPDYYLANPLEIVAFWKGFRGLASHGGALGIMVSLYIFSRRRADQPYLWLLDRVAGPTALGGFFIRMGNLMNSEILGLPSDVPWAMTFTRVDAVARHPAQLYEALSYLLIFFLLHFLYLRRGPKLPPGTLIGTFFATVFGARFFIEFVKERHAAFEAGLPLSMGQILSVPIIALGLALIIWGPKWGGATGEARSG
ncbi:MAG: prolipoprotein diacylglyceryl transferase [Gemmatimonadetes bacterium]|nr:prolipoprotein diacylglyceryl transferase [Gemmatimonadota bacterium]